LKPLSTYIFAAFIFLITALSAQDCFSQTQSLPALERRVTLNESDSKAVDVLREIEKQSKCSFSYSSSLIPESKMVSVKISNKSVREALDKIFSGKITYKSRGEHIILSKAPEQPKVISGYVENTKGERVSGASVYDSNTMASATTNEYGYFEMKIRREAPIQLEVSKSAYTDTVIPLQPATPTLQTIVIEEKKDTTLQFVLHVMKDTKDSLVSAISDAGAWAKKQLDWNDNVKNIKDTLHSDVQISFVPFLGTNGRLSGNVTTDWSFNVLGGYNRGVNKGEFSGFLNVDREDVRHIQVAGFANLVGGDVSGVQSAGFTNVNLSNTNGLQLGGFSNVDLGNFEGAQFAGFSNIVLGKTKGAQFAGFTNICLDTLAGLQMAGFANIAMHHTKAPQFAGFLNFAPGRIEGFQASGFMNIAGNMKGSQIGFFNYADSLSGVPIGFISYVKSGYHKLEFSYDEMKYGHIAFRTGVQHFYNIITVGALTDFNTDTVDWTFGYGIGCAPKLAKKVALNIDLTANQIIHGNIANPLNQLAKLNLGVDVNLSKKFSLYGGVVLNGYFTQTGAKPLAGSENIHSFYNHRFDSDYQMKSWIGWKVALRLF